MTDTTCSNVFGLWIGNEQTPAATSEQFNSINPANGDIIGTFASGSAADVNRAVTAARLALEGDWGRISPLGRGRRLFHVRDLIQEHAEALAEAEALDTGKPISMARSDVATAARYFEFYGALSDKIYGDHIPIAPGILDVVTREPIGVSAQIVPWNFPLMIATRGLAVALAAGNTVVLKTPEEAPLSCAIFADLLASAQLFPDGVINILHGGGETCGAPLAAHPDVNLVTFTGSVQTGRKVAAAAAANGKPSILELGGKSPAIIFADADIDSVAKEVVASSTEVSGQSCDAATRVLVDDAVHDRLVDRIVALYGELTVGPAFEDPDLGPLISEQQLARVEDHVRRAREEGARLVVGGSRLQRPPYDGGWFMEPTLFTDVEPTMKIAREEVFGPVLCVIPFSGVEDAVRIANGTEYGLAASVWTRDMSVALDVGSRLQSGQVYINCLSSGDGPAIPFGGVKNSGYGREKGVEALRAYTCVKNTCIRFAPSEPVGA